MNLLLFRSSPKLWMQISSLVFSRFFLLHRYSVSDCPWIPPYSSYLPRDSDPRLVGFDCELVVIYFLPHNCLRKLANHGQLVAKVLVESFKVVRQRDSCLTVGISGDITVMDVKHVRGLDERVAEVLVFRVEGMVNHEATAALENSAGDREVSGDADTAIEEARKAGARAFAKHPCSAGAIGVTNYATVGCAHTVHAKAVNAVAQHAEAAYTITPHGDPGAACPPHTNGVAGSQHSRPRRLTVRAKTLTDHAIATAANSLHAGTRNAVSNHPGSVTDKANHTIAT